MAVRTFKQSTRYSPAKATGPAETRRGVRRSASSTSGAPSRVNVGSKRGVRSAPRDARSL